MKNKFLPFPVLESKRLTLRRPTIEDCSEIIMDAYTHKQNEPSKKLLLKHNFIFDPYTKDEDNLNNWVYKLCNLKE